ncbi:MAG: hypothetical protein Q8M44_07555 [bacterium]|nr:hypothetical protein [bacterium]
MYVITVVVPVFISPVHVVVPLPVSVVQEPVSVLPLPVSVQLQVLPLHVTSVTISCSW